METFLDSDFLSSVGIASTGHVPPVRTRSPRRVERELTIADARVQEVVAYARYVGKPLLRSGRHILTDFRTRVSASVKLDHRRLPMIGDHVVIRCQVAATKGIPGGYTMETMFYQIKGVTVGGDVILRAHFGGRWVPFQQHVSNSDLRERRVIIEGVITQGSPLLAEVKAEGARV